MKLDLARVIVFTADMERMTAFYGDIIGLDIIGREKGWVEFAAGACNIALHEGKPQLGKWTPKLVFYAADVAAARTALMKRGLKGLGPVKSTAKFDMCDGRDPDGNRVQISSRKK